MATIYSYSIVDGNYSYSIVDGNYSYSIVDGNYSYSIVDHRDCNWHKTNAQLMIGSS